ncbi:MAG: hypothetical protein RLZZ203_1490 [Cyanobacteriota bacterium]|jgi:hypothetical protein
MNRYFISYQAFSNGKLVRVGNCDISYLSIHSGSDIAWIEQKTLESLQSIVKCDQVVIINWKRFEEIV